MSHYYSENTNITVHIIKNELRAIGHYATYQGSQSQGYYWRNKTNATNYFHDEDLYKALEDLEREDPEFFEVVMDRIDNGMYTWADEKERRATVAAHTPQEQKYVIYDTNDYGQQVGDYIATSTIMSTGDEHADRTNAIRKWLKGTTGSEMGVGFYGAREYEREDINKQIGELEVKLHQLRNL